MTRRIGLVGLALLALSMTGCLEEDRVITLLPDGKHGKMTIERAISGQMAQMMMEFGGQAKEDAAKSFAAQQLAGVQGVQAWTDISTEFTDDGKLKFKATGWFEDLGQVVQGGENSGATFKVEQTDGKLKVTMTETTGDEGNSQENSVFSQSDEEYAMSKQMAKGMIGGMLAGFRMSVKLELPGAVESVEGFTQEGNTVSVTRGADEVLKLIDTMFETADELRPKVKAGELTVEQAEAQMKAKLSQDMAYTATCTLPTGGDDAIKAFEAQMADAVKEFEASDWKAAIADAKAQAEAAQEMNPGQMGGMGNDEDGDEEAPAEDSLAFNERAAIGSLKTLSTAQALFRESDKDGNKVFDYAPSLEALGDLIDGVLASGTKNGYTFKLIRSEKAPEFLWMAVAAPQTPGTTGKRYFAINHEGVVYESDSEIPTNPECTIEGGKPVR